MKGYTNCPNCDEPIKGGFRSNELLNDKRTEVINLHAGTEQEGFCEKCGLDLLKIAVKELQREKNGLQENLLDMLEALPVVTIHSPVNWDYTVLGMATGQSSTGTGVLTEFTSSITDFFGSQSNRHNTKVKDGEDRCMAQIRLQALDMGGNAVIGTDIDYSEVGSGKGILLVCMSGTVVKLNNLEILTADSKTDIDNLIEINERFEVLEELNLNDLF